MAKDCRCSSYSVLEFHRIRLVIRVVCLHPSSNLSPIRSLNQNMNKVWQYETILVQCFEEHGYIWPSGSSSTSGLCEENAHQNEWLG